MDNRDREERQGKEDMEGFCPELQKVQVLCSINWSNYYQLVKSEKMEFYSFRHIAYRK